MKKLNLLLMVLFAIYVKNILLGGSIEQPEIKTRWEDLFGDSKELDIKEKLSQLTDEEKLILGKERTTNLVIINDVSEIIDESMNDSLRFELKNALNEDQLVLCSKALYLAAQKKYQSFCPADYICKQVKNNYLLFIPEKMQYKEHSVNLQNALLGLSYTQLSNYDYVNYKEEEFLDVKEKWTLQKNIGKSLLYSLNSLAITSIDFSLLPFFNIFLSGHGEKGFIAELSVKFNAENKRSDFLEVMKFFNTALRTKSVSLSSCFIGGKQIIDTYGMYDEYGKPVFDKFSNKILEELSYTIINWGTLYKPVYVLELFSFSAYFNLLNKPNLNYEDILRYVRLRYSKADNYISIKLPHTSWFSPVEFKEDTETLSQVGMSTRESEIIIKDRTKVIILEANYIPQTVKISNYAIPTLMPVNYYNQSYYFKSLELINYDQAIFALLKSLIFEKIRVNEEILISFERIKIGSTVYKNVYCFVSKKSLLGDLRTGFIYENQDGAVFEISWKSDFKVLSSSDFNDSSIKVKELKKEVLDFLFKIIGDTVQQKLSKGLQPEFIQTLSELKKTDQTLHLLEKSMDFLYDRNIKTEFKKVFNKLLIEQVITSKNLSKLILLLDRGFNSEKDFIRLEINQMFDQLIDQGIITQENWIQLLPMLQAGIINPDSDVRKNVAKLLKKLISKNIVLSLEKINPIIEKGKIDLDEKVRRFFVILFPTK